MSKSSPNFLNCHGLPSLILFHRYCNLDPRYSSEPVVVYRDGYRTASAFDGFFARFMMLSSVWFESATTRPVSFNMGLWLFSDDKNLNFICCEPAGSPGLRHHVVNLFEKYED